MADVNFEKIELPHSNICENSIEACFSPDAKTLLISYCNDYDWKGQLCCANLDSSGFPNEITRIREFQQQSYITSIGCSQKSRVNSEQFISYSIRSCDPKAAENSLCDEVLYRVSLERTGGVPSPLLNRPSGPKKFKSAFNLNIDTQSHCWVQSENDILLFGGVQGIFKYGLSDGISMEPDSRSIYELAGYEQIKDAANQQFTRVGNYISSNILDIGAGKVQFIEAPYFINKHSTESNPLKKAFDTLDGTLITLDLDGKVITKVPFPALPLGQKAVLSRAC